MKRVFGRPPHKIPNQIHSFSKKYLNTISLSSLEVKYYLSRICVRLFSNANALFWFFCAVSGKYSFQNVIIFFINENLDSFSFDDKGNFQFTAGEGY